MTRREEDPVLTSARREALVALVIWVVMTAWSVGYCALYGYGRDPETIKFVLWFPDWIFWGVVVPWLVCILVSLWYAMILMRDEDLGSSDNDGSDDPQHAPEREHGG